MRRHQTNLWNIWPLEALDLNPIEYSWENQTNFEEIVFEWNAFVTIESTTTHLFAPYMSSVHVIKEFWGRASIQPSSDFARLVNRHFLYPYTKQVEEERANFKNWHNKILVRLNYVIRNPHRLVNYCFGLSNNKQFA